MAGYKINLPFKTVNTEQGLTKSAPVSKMCNSFIEKDTEEEE